MKERDLEHPDITRVMRDGLPDAEEIKCPVCGEIGYTFYRAQGEVIGCLMCVDEVSADELLSEL